MATGTSEHHPHLPQPSRLTIARPALLVILDLLSLLWCYIFGRGNFCPRDTPTVQRWTSERLVFLPIPLEFVKNKEILPFFWQTRPFWPFKSNPRGHEKWTLAPIFLPSIRLSRCTSEMSNSGHSMSAKRNRKLFFTSTASSVVDRSSILFLHWSFSPIRRKVQKVP